MNVIIKIEGRDAVPVRALPWLTAWHFGAESVAEALGHQGDHAFRGLHAYRSEDGEVVQVLPSDWRARVLPGVEDVARLDLADDEYEVRATRCLPDGAFVWLDEWVGAYERCADGPGDLRLLLGDEDQAAAVGLNEEDRDDLDDRELSVTRLIPKVVRGIIFEGFATDANEVIEDDLPSSNATLKRGALIRQYAQRWPTIERDLRDAAENGLSQAARAARHGYWDEASALRWARDRGKLEESIASQGVPSPSWPTRPRGSAGG